MEDGVVIYYYTILHIILWSASKQQASKQASNKHFTEAKTSPFPAGVSKSGKLFFDGEP